MPRKWWVLAAVACGTFMATLDSSIVNIALPTLTKELDVDLYQVKWVVIAYLLFITCLVLPFGRLADLVGRKPVFELGFTIFTAGSALCGIAPTLGFLITARVVQAIGASMLMANGPALITSAFPSHERGKALGTMAMVVSAGLISGPSIGGMLISEFGWRSIFWVNIPVGLTGLFLVHRFVAKDVLNRAKAPFDWAGALLQTVFMVCFIIVFDPPRISFSGGDAFPISRWVMVVITVIFAALFLKIEKEVKAPLLDLSLLGNRTFWTANLASFFTFVSFSSVSVLTPFFLEEVLKLPTRSAGLFMTAIPLTILVVAPVSGRLSDKLGTQELSFAGALIGALSLLSMSGVFGFGMYEGVSKTGIVLALCSLGLATGLFQSPNNNAIMGAVPPNKLGVASALLATVRNLGLVTGTGLATGLFTWRMSITSDFVASMHFTFFVAGVIALGAMLASLGRGRRQRPPQQQPIPAPTAPQGQSNPPK
jgi:EmrB/QacA subfamily drug resistance transporter